jgi:hypothetical protein
MTSDTPISRAAETSAKSGLRDTWEKAAPGWAKWEREFSAGLSAATDTLIDMAGVRPGGHVPIWLVVPVARPSRQRNEWGPLAA